MNWLLSLWKGTWTTLSMCGDYLPVMALIVTQNCSFLSLHHHFRTPCLSRTPDSNPCWIMTNKRGGYNKVRKAALFQAIPTAQITEKYNRFSCFCTLLSKVWLSKSKELQEEMNGRKHTQKAAKIDRKDLSTEPALTVQKKQHTIDTSWRLLQKPPLRLFTTEC